MPSNSKPERAPQYVFIARRPPELPSDDDYLNAAFDFHSQWKLDPLRVNSFEAIIAKLAKKKAKLRCIRIVSHGAFGSIKVPFFSGAPGIEWGADLLRAVAKGDTETLAFIVGRWDIVLSNGTVAESAILRNLRDENPEVLAPFGLASAGALSGVMLEFFSRATQLAALLRMKQNGANVPSRVLALFIRIMRQLLDPKTPGGLRGLLAKEFNTSLASVLALQKQILESAPVDLELNEDDLIERAGFLDAADRALHNRSFRQKLKVAQHRFDASSFIDIRGCTVGSDTEFLNAMAVLLSGGSPPTVSAPKLFMVFGQAVSRRFRTIGDAESAATEPIVNDEVKHWIKVIGKDAFLTLSAKKRLVSYLDSFVLPVAEQPTFPALLVLAPDFFGGGTWIAPNGSSGFLAVTDWLKDQWTDATSSVQGQISSAGKALRKRWTSADQAPMFSAVRLNEEILAVCPDPRYQAAMGRSDPFI